MGKLKLRATEKEYYNSININIINKLKLSGRMLDFSKILRIHQNDI
jgi:hypothetical protein